MYNPLLADLSSLKNEDLDNKISELMRKYFIAARMGQGGVAEQISTVLYTYKEEQSRRHAMANQKLAETRNQNLDDFINVDS